MKKQETRTEEMSEKTGLKTGTKDALNKLRCLIDDKGGLPIPASASSPIPVGIVVEFVNDATVALLWVDAQEKIQRLELHSSNALLLAQKIVKALDSKYERTEDGDFVPKGMIDMFKKCGKKG